ncbi:Rpn family recombination-promoting nuclease/putative transposase [Fuchsiella alkaliacetigena]|uniref:Rpn family recombination-promoting nuclease/putative transposase n=1 Tax=Fuchsiella alkaliacetigena TaxID=957042 RepID=UPI00200A3F9C|nr:Rpn family recombination-promoting nuclease/putative transposase [Fuchsiella alkaliacetigena]MCK8825401.1 Rpn family recombination-promoting nuclease/putative transposase [Fuchsiella alkaliacetigena]
MCRLNPRVDFAFKKLFGSEENKDILISFINSVLDEEEQIAEVILKNPYNQQNFKDDKLSILDIKAVDEKGNWYNIEMQITDQEYYDKRALYYWARLYTGQLKSGVNYDKLEKAIVINILNFNCLEEENYHNIYRLLNCESKEELINHQEIHFIELEKYDKDLSEIQTALDRWTEFLKKAHQYDQEQLPAQLAEIKSIEKASKVLNTMYLSEEEREVYEARLKWLRDEEMALKKAEKKGMERGLEKGLEKGKKERNVEIARRLLRLNIEVGKIIEATELDKDKIEEIKKEMED